MELTMYLEPLIDGGTRPVFVDLHGEPYHLKRAPEGPNEGAKKVGTVNLAAAEFTATKQTVIDTFKPILASGERPVLPTNRGGGGGGVVYLHEAEADAIMAHLLLCAWSWANKYTVPRTVRHRLGHLFNALSEIGSGTVVDEMTEESEIPAHVPLPHRPPPQV